MKPVRERALMIHCVRIGVGADHGAGTGLFDIEEGAGAVRKGEIWSG